MRRAATGILLVASAVLVASTLSTCRAGSRSRVERVLVHGRSLEGNLAGDPPDRNVSVYLPAGYAIATTHRYPVLYLLHGFGDDDNAWFGRAKHFIDVSAALDTAIANRAVPPLIVVMPNANTRFYGSMYSNSPTTGDWESFVTRELVAFVDARYRTLPVAASRGLAGHSMGGYGALRLALRAPGVFSAIYALSPCCLTPDDADQRAASTRAEAVRTFNDLARADFSAQLALASAAAWSSNPGRPPLFLDLPTTGGVTEPAIVAKWSANSPLSMLDRDAAGFRQLRGLAFDMGNQDAAGFIESVRVLDARLTKGAIAHDVEIYDGTHDGRIAERFVSRVLPYFSSRLAF